MNVKVTMTKRGRPPQTPAEAELVRDRIVTAAGEVFAAHGSRGSNVALIIERAGIARPTFYRYFANAEEPLHVLLDSTDEALIRAVRTAVDGAPDAPTVGIRMIDAYLSWAHDLGPILRPVFAEMYDPASPVSLHRDRVLELLRALIHRKSTELGRTAPVPLELDTLLNACTFVVYRISGDGQPDPADIAAARTTMVRLALTVLDTDAPARD